MAKQKPFDNARGFIEQTPGKTDGKYGIGTSGQSTRLPRKKPRADKKLYFGEEIIDELPAGSKVRITKSGKIDMVIRYEKPRPAKKEPKSTPKQTVSISDVSFTFRTKK